MGCSLTAAFVEVGLNGKQKANNQFLRACTVTTSVGHVTQTPNKTLVFTAHPRDSAKYLKAKHCELFCFAFPLPNSKDTPPILAKCNSLRKTCSLVALSGEVSLRSKSGNPICWKIGHMRRGTGRLVSHEASGFPVLLHEWRSANQRNATKCQRAMQSSVVQ